MKINKLVDFHTAKLLKEKGFNEPCGDRFDENGIPTATKLGMHMHPNNYSDSYSAPRISDIVDWLLEKHGIWISVFTNSSGKFNYLITKTNSKEMIDELNTKFDTPKEAYLSAIEYTLKNLI